MTMEKLFDCGASAKNDEKWHGITVATFVAFWNQASGVLYCEARSIPASYFAKGELPEPPDVSRCSYLYERDSVATDFFKRIRPSNVKNGSSSRHHAIEQALIFMRESYGDRVRELVELGVVDPFDQSSDPHDSWAANAGYYGS